MESNLFAVSFIKHTVSSSREFYLQGSIVGMTLHLSSCYYRKYLGFTASWMLDFFFSYRYEKLMKHLVMLKNTASNRGCFTANTF